jgi:hypothetical protein
MGKSLVRIYNNQLACFWVSPLTIVELNEV